MSWKKTLLATVITGSLGAGLYAALPAGAATRPTLAPASATVAATAPQPNAPATCETEEWPDEANGRPATLDRHDLGGFYIWHDDSGWHLIVTHQGDAKMEFTGYITTNGSLSAERVYDEKDDYIRVGPKDHTVAFAFANYGGFDGIDFQTRCADTLTVHLRIDGKQATPEQVFIGRNKVNPTSVPFTIERDGIR